MKKIISTFIFILIYNMNFGQTIPDSTLKNSTQKNDVKIFYAEKSELIVIQCIGLNKDNLSIQLFDQNGKFIQETTLYQGSTLAYFDTQTMYNGDYTVKIIEPNGISIENVTVKKK